ncbi:COG4705 family protein [Acidisoma sp. C75]
MRITTMPLGESQQSLLNKVPEVTLIFWVIKIMATTVGETAADFLNIKMGFGLTGTSIVMSVLLIGVIIQQIRSPRYIPSLYWLSVVMVSVVGTLITDNLSDNMGVSLLISTPVFAVILAITFAVWYASEKTLSIHTIYTRKRELFYWAAILFTFALGTAAGDLMAERLALGYFPSLLIFAIMIAAITAYHFLWQGNAILCFWLAYILTRPLGASCGDLLSQPVGNGGLGLGTTATSAIFLLVILGLVWFLTTARKRELAAERLG